MRNKTLPYAEPLGFVCVTSMKFIVKLKRQT